MIKRLFIVLVLGFSLNLFGLAVEEWKWGFDGTVLGHHINPLSIMISNPMPVPFDGVVTLHKTDYMGKRVGALLVKKVFVGPYGSKWVQFYPYTRDNNEEWIVSWGHGAKQRETIKVSSIKGRAIVYLSSDAPVLAQQRIRLSYFPENLFPPSVTATDALSAVVIDKVPEFTPLQRQAFHDWLFAGGKVYILESDGKFPQFGQDYDYLNINGNRAEVGAGEVIRHSGNGVITPKTLGRVQKIKAVDNTIYVQDSEDSYFRKLRSQLKTNHNWVLIFLLSILYGLLVTVVNFIIGRRSRKAWKPIAFFLSMVIIFSFLLAWCGRRGYGEKTHILGLSYAKELEPGRFDVAQWLDIFVTSGDYYKISHKDRNNIYADCQTRNALNAEIYNGQNGLFLVDIPLFSSMQLYHRMDVTAKKVFSADLSYRRGAGFTDVKVKLTPDFPKPIVKVIAVADNKVCPLDVTDGGTVFSCHLPNDKVKSVSRYIRNWSKNGGMYGFFDENDDAKSVFESMIPPLIVRSRGGDKVISDYLPTASAADDKIDIFVMCATPEEFKTNGDVIKSEDGFTLFHFIRPSN